MSRGRRRVRVLHVYNFLYDGGTERYIHTLISRMNPALYSFGICCLVERGTKAEKFEDEGFPVYTLGVRRGFSPANVANNVSQVLRLARLIKRLQVDVVHTHDNHPAVYARLAAWLARVPVVYVTYHNVYEWLRPIHHRANRLLALTTTRIIANSWTVKARSAAKDRIPDRKYRVIYNGVVFPPERSPESRNRYRAEWGLPTNAKVIGNVASLSRRKGQALLLRAFGQIAGEFPETYVVIVGSRRQDEPDVDDELKRIALQSGVSDRVIFAGSRDDVLELMGAFDLYAMPSLVEGFGLSLVEAVCAGIPAVASNIEPFLELTENGEHAVLFRSGDWEDLAAKLRYALTHTDEMVKLGEKSRRYMRRMFSIERMVSEYEELYATDLAEAGLISTSATQ